MNYSKKKKKSIYHFGSLSSSLYCLSVHLSIYLSISLSLCQCIHPSIHPSMHSSVLFLYIYLFIYLFILLLIYLAHEAFYLGCGRLMSRFMSNQSKYTLDSVLSKLSCPLLLLWGNLDPWVGPGKAEQIKAFYPNTSVVNLQAGHCPHDEVPDLVNAALVDWLSSI